MNCAVQGCFKFVDKEGLAGFCKEHRFNAVYYGIEVLERKLNEQKRQLDTLSHQVQSLERQLRRR